MKRVHLAMNRINRDTFIACILLAITALFFWETFNIPTPEYASIGSDVWPRVLLVPLFVLGLIYLVQSLRQQQRADEDTGDPEVTAGGVLGFIVRFRNPLSAFAIFFLFLLTIDYLGMLIGGIALVFLLLTVLGHHSPRHLALNATVAVLSVGLVWSVFTYLLRVYLPQGELLQIY